MIRRVLKGEKPGPVEDPFECIRSLHLGHVQAVYRSTVLAAWPHPAPNDVIGIRRQATRRGRFTQDQEQNRYQAPG
jgi:hypothetical protein